MSEGYAYIIMHVLSIVNQKLCVRIKTFNLDSGYCIRFRKGVFSMKNCRWVLQIIILRRSWRIQERLREDKGCLVLWSDYKEFTIFTENFNMFCWRLDIDPIDNDRTLSHFSLTLNSFILWPMLMYLDSYELTS